MKRMVFVLALALATLFFGGCSSAQDAAKEPPGVLLLEYGDYQKIRMENIRSLRIIRFTEGGAHARIVEDRAQIKKIYDGLRQIRLMDETEMSAVDSTTVYVFTLDGGEKISIEFEGEWIVIGKKHYLFERSGA